MAKTTASQIDNQVVCAYAETPSPICPIELNSAGKAHVAIDILTIVPSPFEVSRSHDCCSADVVNPIILGAVQPVALTYVR